MDFLLLGNHPFLDFVNTRPVVDSAPLEQIANGRDLAALLERLGLPVTPPRRGDADEAAASARAMREAFRALLLSLRGPAAGSSVRAALGEANGWLAGLGPPALETGGGELGIAYPASNDSWLRPLLRAGLELLASPLLGRVRKCSNPDCVLWYLDTTKSGTRRWCSMGLCGNANKVRAFRARQLQD